MSRHLAVLKQMDIIKDEGKLTLTDHGKELEKRYEEESVRFRNGLGNTCRSVPNRINMTAPKTW